MCLSIKLKYWNLCALCNNRNAISLSTVQKWALKVWVHVISVLANSESTKHTYIEGGGRLSHWGNVKKYLICIFLLRLEYFTQPSALNKSQIQLFYSFFVFNSICLSVSVIGRFCKRMKLMVTVFFLPLAVPFTME